MDETSTAEEKRELERVRKQAYREKQARQASVAEAGKKKALPAPKALQDRLGGLARLTDPVSPAEARRQIFAATTAAGKIIRSKAEFTEEEFETAGDAFADVSKAFWPLRLFIKVLAPLVLTGALIQIGAKLVTETGWWQAWKEKQRENEEAKRGELRVAQAPGEEAAPGYQQPPRPGIRLARKPPV